MGRTRWLQCAAVAVLAAGLHLKTLGFDFVFDDLHLIVHNAYLREPWSALTCFAHDFWHGTPSGAAYYRPVVTSTLALNGRILGWGPAGFHLVNVLVHAANAVLLLVLARRLGCPDWAALCAAVFFAVHPVAAWPVGSIVARVDLLPALFVLCAWLALGGRSRLRPAWVGLFFLLALLSKESAAAFLAVPLLGLRAMPDPDERAGTRWRIAAALGAAAAAYLGLRLAAGLGFLVSRNLIDPLTNTLGLLPLPARLWAAAGLSGRYLLYLLAPIRFADPHDYFRATTLPSPFDAAVIASLVLLSTWVAAVFLLWRRRDRIALPLAFALASFLPASNLIVPIGSLYAQNFLYMPLIGLSLALGKILGRIEIALPRSRHRLIIPAGVACAALAGASFVETGIWRDGVSLLTAWTERFPSYPPAHSALGVALLDRGRPEEAIGPLRRALAISDRSVEAHYNLGLALLLTGHERAAREEALSHLRTALDLQPGMTPARLQAARALHLLGRPREEAVELEALARLLPDDSAIRSRLIEAYIRAGSLDAARKAAQAARQEFPQAAWFDFCLARIEARLARPHEALALLEAAIAKDGSVAAWVGGTNDLDPLAGLPEFERIRSAGQGSSR